MILGLPVPDHHFAVHAHGISHPIETVCACSDLFKNIW